MPATQHPTLGGGGKRNFLTEEVAPTPYEQAGRAQLAVTQFAGTPGAGTPGAGVPGAGVPGAGAQVAVQA